MNNVAAKLPVIACDCRWPTRVLCVSTKCLNRFGISRKNNLFRFNMTSLQCPLFVNRNETEYPCAGTSRFTIILSLKLMNVPESDLQRNGMNWKFGEKRKLRLFHPVSHPKITKSQINGYCYCLRFPLSRCFYVCFWRFHPTVRKV